MSRPSSTAGPARLQLTINLSSCKYDLLRDVAAQLSYEVDETGALDWDLHWIDSSVSAERVQKLLPYQRLNHFPGMLEGICRKAALTRNMQRMAARLPALYNFYPTSLVLPEQLDEFAALLRRNKAKVENHSSPCTYILKPSGGTMGRGIRLVQTLAQLHSTDVSKDSVVAQAYVADPLLLDGLKFDLRVYALVQSVDPLKVHLYEGGLARLATVAYQAPSGDNLHLQNLHLTNYAVNKDSANFVQSNDFSKGTKRLLSAVLSQLSSQHAVSVESLRASMAAVIVKTILAIQPSLAHTYHTSLSSTSASSSSAPLSSAAGSTTAGGQRGSDNGSPLGMNGSSNGSTACTSLDHGAAAGITCSCPPSRCFEVLGFDIMFDAALKPWLLEVNHSPSFCTDEPIDYQVKLGLLTETIAALGQDVADRQAYLAEEAMKQTQRLYVPQRSYVRRPLSGAPRNLQLAAAAAALDEITTTSHSLLSTSTVNGGGSGSHQDRPGSAGLKAHLSGGWRHQQAAAAQPLQPGARSYSPAPGGGFTQIYPTSGEEAEGFSKALTVATDLFQDQRCQCLWCCRRREARMLQWTAWELASGARRPSSATDYQRLAAGSESGATDSNTSNNRSSGTGDAGNSTWHPSGSPGGYSNGPGYGISPINSSHVLPRSSSARRPPRSPASPSRSTSSRSRDAACTSCGRQHQQSHTAGGAMDSSNSCCRTTQGTRCSKCMTSEEAIAGDDGRCSAGASPQQKQRRVSQDDKTVARYLRMLKAAGLSSATSWRTNNLAPDIALSPGELVRANSAHNSNATSNSAPAAHTQAAASLAAVKAGPAPAAVKLSSSRTLQDPYDSVALQPTLSRQSECESPRPTSPLRSAPERTGQAWTATDLKTLVQATTPHSLTRTLSSLAASPWHDSGTTAAKQNGVPAPVSSAQRQQASSASKYKGPSAILRSPTAMTARRAGSAPRMRPDSGSSSGTTSSTVSGTLSGGTINMRNGESAELMRSSSLQGRHKYSAVLEQEVSGRSGREGLLSSRPADITALMSQTARFAMQRQQQQPQGKSGGTLDTDLVSMKAKSTISLGNDYVHVYMTDAVAGSKGTRFPTGPVARS